MSLTPHLTMHLDKEEDDLLFKYFYRDDFSCHRRWETNEMYSEDQYLVNNNINMEIRVQLQGFVEDAKQFLF